METFLKILGLFIYGIGLFLSIFYFVKHRLFPDFFKEKEKNLATKQDIEEITEKVKKVENKYESQLLALKTSLEEKSYLRKFRFDKELIAYTDIIEKLSAVQIAQSSLWGFDKFFDRLKMPDTSEIILKFNDYNKSYNAEIELHKERIKEFRSVTDAFGVSINKNSIFCKPDIYDALKRIDDFIKTDVLIFSVIGVIAEAGNTIPEIRKTFSKLTEQINAVQAMIRKRISEIDTFEDHTNS